MPHESRQVLFVQGAGAGVHDAWDGRLVASLRRHLGPRYSIRYPRMPDEAEPSYVAWRGALLRELAELRPGAIVIGHSVGGTILVNVLAAHPSTPELGAVVLIAAPFVGDGGWPRVDWEPVRDLGATHLGSVPVHLYHGLADTTVPPAHAELYARALPHARLCLLPGRDHQLDDDLREIGAVVQALG